VLLKIDVYQVDYTIATSSDITEVAEEIGAKVVNKDVSSGPLESNCQLAVASNAAKNDTALTNLAASVKDGGFVLTVEDGVVHATSFAGLVLVFKAIVDNKTILLLRKVRDRRILLSFFEKMRP
jgi:hypothetical protein